MQSRNGLRLAGYRAPLAVVFSVFALLGCADVNDPALRPTDDWAEAAVVSVLVENQITLFSRGKPAQTRSVSQLAELPVLRGFGQAHMLSENGSRGGDGPRTIVRHFRDHSGLVHSIGMRFDDPGKPPSRFYLFENGHIKSIVKPTYERRGLGYVRSKARVTHFGADGVPNSQVESRASKLGANQVASNAPNSHFAVPSGIADALALFLPRQLYAEETDEGCAAEWAAYATAAFALASYSLALAAAIDGCISGVVGSCTLIEAAAIKVGGATTAALVALDRLATCLEMQKRPTNDSELTARGEDGDNYRGQNPVDMDRLKGIVEQFITDSIAAGEYWCSQGGDYCIFY